MLEKITYSWKIKVKTRSSSNHKFHDKKCKYSRILELLLMWHRFSLEGYDFLSSIGKSNPR